MREIVHFQVLVHLVLRAGTGETSIGEIVNLLDVVCRVWEQVMVKNRKEGVEAVLEERLKVRVWSCGGCRG